MREGISKNGTYYRINESNSKRKTLVFVHGLSGSSSAWIEYEKLFGDTYNILTYDLRGHGKSLKYKNFQDYKIQYFAQDLHDLVAQLSIEEFILISHSYGTVIALEYLRMFPKKVVKSIFLSPIYHIKASTLSSIPYWLSKIYIFVTTPLPFHPHKGKHLDYAKYLHSGDWNLKRMFADITNTQTRIFMYCLSQIYQYHNEDFWKELSLTVLIVHGKNDSISVVENAVTISKLVNNSRLILVPDADHILVLNHFKEVSSAIESFVES